MAEPPVLEVWIDGDCDVCRRSKDWCSNRDGRRRLHFVDLHAPATDQPPGSAEAMMRAVHVRLADGTVETGFDGWRRILSELAGWRWLAWATGLPGVNHLGAFVYSMAARNRHRFGNAKT
jgi:predicted DCC family thiol-disulfide oxidoreductase YuxK